jgi:hypothetical protein
VLPVKKATVVWKKLEGQLIVLTVTVRLSRIVAFQKPPIELLLWLERCVQALFMAPLACCQALFAFNSKDFDISGFEFRPSILWK